VFKFLEKHHGNYDIIFADPPYGMEQSAFEKIIELIFENELLDEEGMLVVEHSKYTKLNHMANFSFQKNYGGSVFTFFEFESDEEETEDLEDEDDS
jgi:16S rRNA G966 N2-methylase RsmD